MKAPMAWAGTRLRSAAVSAMVSAAMAALAAAAAPAHALSASELYQRLAPSVWVVRTFDADNLPLAQGSAVVTGAQSLVTNCHVLRKAKRVEITHEKLKLPATLELWDIARDLCQLKAGGLDAPAVALADDPSLAVGETVYTLGSPAGQELTLSPGIVSALRHDDAQRLVAIQTSAPISPGSSGGGLFDEQGRLIGITTLIIAAANAQNLNIAIPIGMVRELPQRHAAAQRAKASTQATASPPAATAVAAPSPNSGAGAPSDPWVWTGKVPFGNQNRYLNTSSLHRDGAYIRFLVAFRSETGQPEGRSVIREVVADCAAKTRNELVDNEAFSPTQLKSYFPGTVVGAETQFACDEAARRSSK